MSISYKETQRRAMACALAEACAYLNADRTMHIKAHGSWHLDSGKLQAALEASGIMMEMADISEEDLVAWERRIAERAKA